MSFNAEIQKNIAGGYKKLLLETHVGIAKVMKQHGLFNAYMNIRTDKNMLKAMFLFLQCFQNAEGKSQREALKDSVDSIMCGAPQNELKPILIEGRKNLIQLMANVLAVDLSEAGKTDDSAG